MAGWHPSMEASRAPSAAAWERHELNGPMRGPLLPGWSEHIGPQGQLYWYNETTEQSTYSRPSAPSVNANGQAIYSGPPPSMAGPSTTGAAQPSAATRATKREKPAIKEPIPGTDGWIKVTTNHGNVFYAHPPSKRSEWIVPDEIRQEIDEWRAELRKAEEEKRRMARQEEEKRQAEEREKRQEEQRQREMVEEQARQERERRQQLAREETRRRKEEEERIHADRLRILQETRQLQENDAKPVIGMDSFGHDTLDREGEDDDKEWQQRIAAEMAQEAEELDSMQGHEPDSTDQAPRLSIEEGRLIFMHMLSSLNGTPREVNPMMPWDRELPKFSRERDYSVLDSVREREAAFNEWCRRRIIEKRQQPAGKSKSLLNGGEKRPQDIDTKRKDASASKQAFRELLQSEVKSTRTAWDDFRKLWRKDRRFMEYGRDDREREKAFREWLKELGKQKKEAAARAENDFITLLEVVLGDLPAYKLLPDTSTNDAAKTWQTAKSSPGLATDPRYDAVGSSSRRAELFSEWARGQHRQEGGNNTLKSSDSKSIPSQEMTPSPSKSSHNADKALKERAEKVYRERAALERSKNRALGQATREESVTQFQQLLIDAIRDPLATLERSFSSLSRDERFNAPNLRADEKERLFYQHTDDLNRRKMRNLEDVFERHAPELYTEDDVALPLIKNDDEIERKNLADIQEIRFQRKPLDSVFQEWKRRREASAQKDFTQMLKENAFVDFWGRLRQELAQKKAQGHETDRKPETGEVDDEDEDTNAPSLLQMAGQIDLDEIHAVLRNDARYRAWRHKPELRDDWIRDYLQHMEIPKMSHFQKALK